MTFHFVTRHPGAQAWARQQGLCVDRWVTHLRTDDVAAGDTVAGTLPVHLAAAVCARGALYLHLRLNVPPEWRGRELSAAELVAAGASLEPFSVQAPGGSSP